MSTESRFPAIMAEAQKPNGSIPHAAVAATPLLEKTVRNDAGSRNPLEREPVIAVAPEPGVVRPSPSATTAPAKEHKTIWRLLRAAAGMLGMLILLLVFARWVVIPIALPVTNDAWPNANLTVITAPNEGH